MTSRSDESLRDRLRAVCAQAEESLPEGDAKTQVTSVRKRLDEAVLWIAVAGQLKAGKSTLVNALLRQKIAPTKETERTTIVTRFRYGDADRVVRLLADGGSMVPWPGLDIASALDAAQTQSGETAKVEAIDVRARNDTLRKYAIVDTPGLNAVSRFDELTLAALKRVDVLIFVTQQLSAEDESAFAGLRAVAPGLPAIGVLSRIDKLGDGRTDDPWKTAERNARQAEQQLRADVSMVIPVVGLLAETSSSDALEEEHMAPLRRLYQAELAEPGTVARYTAEHFADGVAPGLPAEEGEVLVSLLDSYGINAAVAEIPRVTGVSELKAALRACSGIETLMEQIRVQFLSVADPLRARAAIAVLDAIAWPCADGPESPALGRLRGDVAEIAADHRFLLLDIVDNLTAYQTRRWPERLDNDPAGQFTALITGTNLAEKLGLPSDVAAEHPEQVRMRLLSRIREWRLIEVRGNLETTRRARAVREYLEALHEDAGAR